MSDQQSDQDEHDSTGPELRTVVGHVKWFDTTKGFGFVVAEGEPRDILLHANVLRNFGQGSVADGAGITLLVQDTSRGAQGVEILNISLPERFDQNQMTDLPDLANRDLSGLVPVAARVKWFDRAKGFGFANIWGRPEDVFIHAEVLRRSGLAELQPGEAVGLLVVDGRRGMMAAEVLAWDAAARGDSSNRKPE